MRIAAKYFSIFFAFLIVITAIPAFIPDEDYFPGAREWLEYDHTTENVPVELNRFNALVGFGAAADKDMVAEGARLVAEANAAINTAYKNKIGLPDLDGHWDNPPLTGSNHLSAIVSAAFEGDPAQWVLDNRDKYNALLTANQMLLDRYGVMMRMEQFSHTLKLDINAPFLSYADLISIQKLNNLSIIDEFIVSNQQAAIHRIQQSISFSRRMMAQSVFLLDKMVAVKLLANDLDTYSVLLDHSPVDIVNLNIRVLKKEETEILKAAKGEYLLSSTMLYPDNLYGNTSYAVELGFIESFIMRHYVKPTMMENRAYKNMWLPFVELQSASFSVRKKQSLTIYGEDLSWWQIYKDLPGYFLAAVAMPSFDTYLSSIDHVDAMITLLNLKVTIYARDIQSDDIANMISLQDASVNAGYAGAKFSWDADAQMLSYEIPDYSDDSIPRVKLTFKQTIKG